MTYCLKQINLHLQAEKNCGPGRSRQEFSHTRNWLSSLINGSVTFFSRECCPLTISEQSYYRPLKLDETVDWEKMFCSHLIWGNQNFFLRLTRVSWLKLNLKKSNRNFYNKGTFYVSEGDCIFSNSNSICIIWGKQKKEVFSTYCTFFLLYPPLLGNLLSLRPLLVRVLVLVKAFQRAYSDQSLEAIVVLFSRWIAWSVSLSINNLCKREMFKTFGPPTDLGKKKINKKCILRWSLITDLTWKTLYHPLWAFFLLFFFNAVSVLFEVLNILIK